MGWEGPLLPEAAVFLAERYGDGTTLRLRDIALVVPGSRAGRRMEELLLEEASRRGLRLSPPLLVTTGTLPELFYAPSAPPASPMLSRRLWSETLRRAPATDVETLFPELPSEGDTRGWDLLAGQLRELQRETAGGGHHFRDVAEACTAGGLLFDDAGRWDLLDRLQQIYAKELPRLGHSDVDLDRLRALQEGVFRCEREVWLIGVAELPRVTREFLGRAAGPIGALIHAPLEEADAFDSLGCVRQAAWAARAIPIETEQFRVANGPVDQAGEILAAIGSLGRVSVEEIVVGIADDDLRPYVEEWLEVAGLPVHFAGGVPIRRSGPFRLLEAVADLLERRDWGSLVALLRHPDVEDFLNSGGPAAQRLSLATLDRYFAEHLSADLSGSPPREIPPALAAVHRRLRILLGPFETRRPAREWPVAIMDLLGQVYGASRLDVRSRSGSRLGEALRAFRESALTLQRLPASLSPSIGGAICIRLLLDDVGQISLPEGPEPAAVEILGWLELPLDDAPVVLVAGVNEPGIPEAVESDALLPDRLRGVLGLVDNDARYGRDAFYLQALLRSRTTVRLIAGRRSPTGDPLRPSRLVLASAAEALAGRVIEFAEGGGAGFTTPLLHAAGGVSEFLLPPDPVLAVERPRILSVTDFRGILADPYRFVLERMMKLEAAHDSARELDGAGFGALAHRVLHRFGHSTEARSGDAAAIARRLEMLLDEESDVAFGGVAFSAVRLQVELLRSRLRSLAEWQGRRVGEGWVIALVEGEPAGGDVDAAERLLEASFDVDGEPVLLRGRIDRVDHHPSTGRWAVLDYKTGDRPIDPEEAHRSKRTGSWKDLQLPLYRHLVLASVGSDGLPILHSDDSLEFGYIHLCSSPGRIGISLASWTRSDLEDADEAARNAIRLLRQGVVTFDPRRKTGSISPGDPLSPLLGHRQLVAARGIEAAEETS